MKNLLSVLFVLLSITSIAQKSFNVKIGPVYSYNDDYSSKFTDCLGYYLGVGFQDKFHEVVGLSADLYFINQINSNVNDKTFSVRSVNAIFGVDIYPFSNAFHFIVGPEIGHTVYVRYDRDKLDVEKEMRFGAVVGASFPLNDRLDFQTRFVKGIFNQQQGFDYNVQAGLSFQLAKH